MAIKSGCEIICPKIMGNNSSLQKQAFEQKTSNYSKKTDQLIIIVSKSENRNISRREFGTPSCQDMKNLLLHLRNCDMERKCIVRHCAERMMSNWKNCERSECTVCCRTSESDNWVMIKLQ